MPGVCLGTELPRKYLSSSENLVTFKIEKPLGIVLHLFLKDFMLHKVKIQIQVLFHFSLRIKCDILTLVCLKIK